MIRAALQYLVNLGKAEIIEADNGYYYSTEQLYPVKEPLASALIVETLSGLVDYIKSEFDRSSLNGQLVQVVSSRQVHLLSALFDDGQRETYMIAEAFSPGFEFDQWYESEDFIIGLQSCFVENDDKAKILKVVGNIKDEAVRQYGDDGVTQQVTAKTGLAQVEDVPIPNPVMLAPFRTFMEIEQPESKFVFRMRQGDDGPECALFEADGGAWKLEAMKKVKAYLRAELDGTGIAIIS